MDWNPEGLEIKVSFHGVWKQSLTELSSLDPATKILGGLSSWV